MRDILLLAIHLLPYEIGQDIAHNFQQRERGFWQKKYLKQKTKRLLVKRYRTPC